jgi:hypothetical protein
VHSKLKSNNTSNVLRIVFECIPNSKVTLLDDHDKKTVVIRSKEPKHIISFHSIPFMVLAMESHIGSKAFPKTLGEEEEVVQN